MYRGPCLWTYENNVSNGVAPGGWVLNNENFVYMWWVCNFEWNDQSHDVKFQRIGAPAREVIMIDLRRWNVS